MKKITSILLGIFMIFGICNLTVLAADENTSNGFYNIGTKESVTITPYAGENKASSTQQDLDADSKADQWYVNSDRMTVSYSAAVTDQFYGVVLVEGSDLPTKDDDIFYIDQVTAESSTIEFDVYPILPKETTELTLYLTSSAEDFTLVSIPLHYVVGAEMDEPTLPTGDLDNDGYWNSKDVLKVLQIGAGAEATDVEKEAADVNNDGFWNSKDVLKILQKGAGKLDSWLD